jgi:chromosome segregation ATPase
MSKIDTLQNMIFTLNKSIEQIEKSICEKTDSIQDLERQMFTLQDTLHVERTQLEEFSKKLKGLQEMKRDTDEYYKQLDQSIDTLMTILTSR